MLRITLFLAGVGLLIVGCAPSQEDSVPWVLAEYQGKHPAAGLSAPSPKAEVRTDAMTNWVRSGQELAQRTEEKDEAGVPEAPATAHEAWQKRRGPAYPSDFWRSFGRDAKELPATLWDDTKATAREPLVWLSFAAAGAAGLAIRCSGTDGQVADHFSRHGHQLNTFWDSVGDVGGHPGTHFAAAGAMYLLSLARNDTKNYEISKTLLNALVLNGLATVALKTACNTESPNGDPTGWPSGHASSSFCLATVIYEEYGPWYGLPLFAFASFVGYERIDARNHDFSDVISGALIGMAIGHAVAKNHQVKILGMDVLPYVHPSDGTVGLALLKEW